MGSTQKETEMTNAKTMIVGKRCERCGSTLFVSQDPLDDVGTTYCLAGHTFAPFPPLPLDEETVPRRPATRKKRKAPAAA
jgi:hypothetical protein